MQTLFIDETVKVKVDDAVALGGEKDGGWLLSVLITTDDPKHEGAHLAFESGQNLIDFLGLLLDNINSVSPLTFTLDVKVPRHLLDREEGMDNEQHLSQAIVPWEEVEEQTRVLWGLCAVGKPIWCEADDGRAHSSFPKEAVMWVATPDDPYPVPLCQDCAKEFIN